MSANAGHNELISQFSGVTGVNAERSRFYLESAAWKLEVALASFYDEDEGEEDVMMPAEEEPSPEPPAPPPQRAQPRFATIAGLQGDDDDSGEEQGQAFYAGGSERSGQQVLGPPRKKKNTDDLVQNMFKSAKEHGAESVEAGSSGAGAHQALPTFRGTGYRLGEEGGDSEVVRGAPFHEAPQTVDTVLKLWKNGFSVDDGELRDFHDPANKEFLDAIHQGEVPRELTRAARGGEVNLNMEDHRTEEYSAPRHAARKAFTGEGHVLGSPAPAIPAFAPAASPNGAPPPAVHVDTAAPTTSVQIRLADGSRMVAKFNHSHTVRDVRAHIVASHPRYSTGMWALMTTFPNKELSDESLSLEDAKLLNAVLVQRMK